MMQSRGSERSTRGLTGVNGRTLSLAKCSHRDYVKENLMFTGCPGYTYQERIHQLKRKNKEIFYFYLCKYNTYFYLGLQI